MRHAYRLHVAALTTLACGAAPPPPASAPSPLIGSEAPAVEGRSLGGEQVSLSALRGRPVLVEFFAQHCKPCLQALPALERLRASSAVAAIIAISEDETQSAAQTLASELGLGFPVVHDRGHLFAGRYRVSELPATFLVDERGQVRWKGTRAHETAELSSLVDSLK